MGQVKVSTKVGADPFDVVEIWFFGHSVILGGSLFGAPYRSYYRGTIT